MASIVLPEPGIPYTRSMQAGETGTHVEEVSAMKSLLNRQVLFSRHRVLGKDRSHVRVPYIILLHVYVYTGFWVRICGAAREEAGGLSAAW